MDGMIWLDRKKKKLIKVASILALIIISIEIFIINFYIKSNKTENVFFNGINAYEITNDGYVVVGSNNNNDKHYEKAEISVYDNSKNKKLVKVYNKGYNSTFYGVLCTDDGYVAVGSYESTKQESENKVRTALIVKYDLSGNVIFENDFQVLGNSKFTNVVSTYDGFIVVGQSIYENDTIGLSNNGGAVIIKYDKDGKPNYTVDETTGRIVIKNSTYDQGEVIITYNSAAKIKFIENKTDSNYYVLDVSLETGEDVFIKVEAYRYGKLIKTLDDIQIRVTKKYLLIANALPFDVATDDNNEYFLDAENRKDYIKFLNADEKFDLRTFDPYRIDNEKECFTYKFLAWTDDVGNILVSLSDLDKPITLSDSKPSLVLYASYESTSALDTDPVYAYMDLKDLDLFKSSNNSYKEIDEKLIYPGLEGGKGIKFNNTSGSDIAIVELIVQEDTLCVSNNACLNMGYKIRKYENGANNLYYYGSANNYDILYEDSDLDSNTYLPYYHSYKEIDISANKILVPKDGAVDIAVFWKWVDRDDIDAKIGNMAIDLNKYKFFLSVKYEKPKNNCTIIR